MPKAREEAHLSDKVLLKSLVTLCHAREAKSGLELLDESATLWLGLEARATSTILQILGHG